LRDQTSVRQAALKVMNLQREVVALYYRCQKLLDNALVWLSGSGGDHL